MMAKNDINKTINTLKDGSYTIWRYHSKIVRSRIFDSLVCTIFKFYIGYLIFICWKIWNILQETNSNNLLPISQKLKGKDSSSSSTTLPPPLCPTSPLLVLKVYLEEYPTYYDLRKNINFTILMKKKKKEKKSFLFTKGHVNKKIA